MIDRLVTPSSRGGPAVSGLRSCLERVVEQHRGASSPITWVGRRPVGRARRCGPEILTLRVAPGASVRLLVKRAPAPQEGEEARRRWERERQVHRDLLSGAGLGTPRYHGSGWDARLDRPWLVLEYVHGDRLGFRNPGHFVAAAAWLGRLQSHFVRNPGRPRSCPLLERHDAPYFLGWTRRVREVAAGLAAPLGRRLLALVERHEPWIEVMTSGPSVVVHGSFRRRHILVEDAATGPRIRPVGWECAALGSPIYDLAFLAEGCRDSTLARMREAYGRALTEPRLPCPGPAELERLMACFRLHRFFRQLAEAPPAAEVPATMRLVQRAERLADSLEASVLYAC